MKYRFIIVNNSVTAIVEHDNSITHTLSDIVVTTIETAKALFPLVGINIDKIIEFETLNPA
jgi:hypothetical protein